MHHTHIFVTYEVYHFTPETTVTHSALIEIGKMKAEPFTLANIEKYLVENVEIESRSLQRKPAVKKITHMQGITVPTLLQS
jgi:hypothetical protein